MKTELMLRDEHFVDPGSKLAKAEHALHLAQHDFGESFYRMGVILKEIRDDDLWKDGDYSDFKEYCDHRQPLGYKKSAVNQFIVASDVRRLLPELSAEKPASGGLSWTERTVRPLAHKDFAPSDVRRLGKKILTQVKKTGKLTGPMVKAICDEDRGVEKQKAKKKGEELDAADTPAKVLNKIKIEAKLWQSSLASMPEDFWSDAESEDRGCLKRTITALSELVSFLRS